MSRFAADDDAYIYSVGVEPELAGRGIGSRLMRDALARLRQHCRSCVLRTEQPKNVRFYQKLGFECVEHTVVPVTGVPVWFFVQRVEGNSGP